jgi:hypothetical protein
MRNIAAPFVMGSNGRRGQSGVAPGRLLDRPVLSGEFR